MTNHYEALIAQEQAKIHVANENAIKATNQANARIEQIKVLQNTDNANNVPALSAETAVKPVVIAKAVAVKAKAKATPKAKKAVASTKTPRAGTKIAMLTAINGGSADLKSINEALLKAGLVAVESAIRNMLSTLKKDGLIASTGRGTYEITDAGKNVLQAPAVTA